ncbi:hypothetical protein D3C71_2123650 [compost metagenome]
MTRLADKLPKPLTEMLRLVNQAEHHFAQFIQLLRQNVGRVLARRNVRIAVAMAAQLALQNVISKTADHLAPARRTETH